MGMAKDNEKRGFLVYATLEEQLAFLTDEQVGQLFRAMFVHFRGEEPVLEDLIVRMTYTGVKNIMDIDREKWERVRAARQEAGRKGGFAKAENARLEETPALASEHPSKEELFRRTEQMREQKLAPIRGHYPL
jgi:hypothetical protein